MTGAELAERVDISRASIYFYLDALVYQVPTAVEKLCAALGVGQEQNGASIPPWQRCDRRRCLMTILSELWADDQGQDIVEYAAMLVALLVIVIGTIVLGRR